MAVLIPNKLVYLATPHTASMATTLALAKIPEALTTGIADCSHTLRVTHHAPRAEIEPFMKGGEVVVTTVRNPFDLVVTWWCRQQSAVKKYLFEGATFLDFVKNVDTVIGRSGPYFKDGEIFWHDVDRVLRYEMLEKDLRRLLDKLELPRVVIPQHNVTKGKKDNWREYYDDESYAVVAERFKKEIEQFGYSGP